MTEVVIVAIVGAIGTVATAVIASRTSIRVKSLERLNTDQHSQGRNLLHELTASVLDIHHKLDDMDQKVDTLDTCSKDMNQHLQDVTTWQVGHDAHHLRIDKDVRELAAKVRSRQRG
jgi:peptidoglycan hydrolase CwlO-like protein